MLADPDDLGARVHAIRVKLADDPSPTAGLLADSLHDQLVDTLHAYRYANDYRRLTAFEKFVLRCEAALGLLILAG